MFQIWFSMSQESSKSPSVFPHSNSQVMFYINFLNVCVLLIHSKLIKNKYSIQSFEYEYSFLVYLSVYLLLLRSDTNKLKRSIILCILCCICRVSFCWMKKVGRTKLEE